MGGRVFGFKAAVPSVEKAVSRERGEKEAVLRGMLKEKGKAGANPRDVIQAGECISSVKKKGGWGR